MNAHLKLFCFLLMVVVLESTYCQTDKKNMIGTHFSLGSGLFHQPGWIGGGYYDTKYYYSIGINYSRILSEHLSLGSGIEYSYSNIASISYSCKRRDNLTLVTIPTHMKYHFWKYFFINGGLLYNVVARNEIDHWVPPYKEPTRKLNMSWGCELGMGIKYEFTSGLVITINPYLRWNGLENVNSGGGKAYLDFLQVKGKKSGFQFRQYGVSLGNSYKL